MAGETVTILKSDYDELLALVASLNRRIRELEEEIRLLKNGHNSNTSSTPPSQDIGRSNKNSLRQKSGKSSGGQRGHKGHTLQRKEIPDEIIEHQPKQCQGCGARLETVAGSVHERRQEIIISVQKKYVEHQSIEKACPGCGRKNRGTFPASIKGPIQYGSSVKALIAYLSVYQFLPYHRMQELFEAIFGISISEGTIDNSLKEMSEKAEGAYQGIKKGIEMSRVVGSDESGCHVKGEKHWIYIWQNERLTYLVASPHRDYKTIEGEFPKGLPRATLVSDCLAAQLKTPAKHHQVCAQAHLIRELNNFISGLGSEWSGKFKEVLEKGFRLKQGMKKIDYKKPPPEVAEIEREVERLLSTDYSGFHKKVQAFIKRLIKHRESILTFLHYEEVPADNNGSERGIRNVKVKVKVSGQFRNVQGADRFARIRSVIDTAIKSSQNVFTALGALSD